MAYKANKIKNVNKPNNTKANNNPDKKPFFGRNLATFGVMIAGIIVLGFIAWFIVNIVNYATKANTDEAQCNPFAANDSEYSDVIKNYKDKNLNIQRMNHNDFTEFDIKLNCVAWSEAQGKAAFKVTAKKKAEDDVYKDVKFRPCLATKGYRYDYTSDFTEYEEYYSTSSAYTLTTSDKTISFGSYSSSGSVSGINILSEFPIKSKTLAPFFYETITEPDMYLMVYWETTVEGSKILNLYILTWSYSEYIVGATGAISK